ncbi:unnamed protein product [Brachionus calyciflorus]|uniref:SWIM-type domain-containing protein n=1 Tax=Brachionus calyciflorus TaxID=104777 RepID=A0A814AWD4_9BILA|nr:unnamed protein product [Brachionus calyciflorus]
MCFSQDKDLENLLRKGDVILVDRGFRDSIEYFENKKLRVMMPAFIAKYRKQLTCQQANHSRLVTKCRWDLLFTNSAEFVNLNDVDLVQDFPRLSYEYILENITFGSYQLKQSLGYLAEHFDINGKLIMKKDKHNSVIILKKNSRVIKGKIQSRHSWSVNYKVNVSYLSNIEHQKNQVPINGWYCPCKNGSRTIGCCSHIASIIFYFGYARYLDEIPKPASFLSSIYPNCFNDSSDEENDKEETQTQTQNESQKKKKESSKKKS